MTKEVDKLLSMILQNGQIKVENGQLLVAPVEIAKKFGDQIRKLKPEILLALGRCPACASKLVVEVEHRERLSDGERETGVVTYCPMGGHYDRWIL